MRGWERGGKEGEREGERWKEEKRWFSIFVM